MNAFPYIKDKFNDKRCANALISERFNSSAKRDLFVSILGNEDIFLVD